jgi:LuxR family maltose regulon positive regulatory protein
MPRSGRRWKRRHAVFALLRPRTTRWGRAERAAFLTTKLSVPPTRPTLVPRPRLLDRLHAGLHGPLTLLAAPAGSGKTTLLSAWHASPKGRTLPLAWVSLDADDNEPVRFWSYVLTALDGVAADVILILDDYHVIAAPPIHQGLAFLVQHLPPRLHLVLSRPVCTWSWPPEPIRRCPWRGCAPRAP